MARTSGGIETVHASPRIDVRWEPYNVDNTGATDVTSQLGSAAAAGAVDLAGGTYLVNGILDVPGLGDFLGCGAGRTIFKLGAGGQIRSGYGGGATGGRIGGFEVDGQGVQNVAGGGLYVAGRNSVSYEDMYIHGCLAPGTLIDGGQNNVFIDIQWGTPGGSEVSLVFDHAVGGLNFYGCEIAGGFRVQQTHTDWSGGYPTWVGPSDIHFFGGRTEYPLTGKPLLYLAAGGNISLNNFGVAGSGSLIIMEQGAQNYPLKTTAINAWNGSTQITVNDASGVTALMSVNVPGCPPETIVNGVSGNVVTLSNAPSADPTGGTAKFGARMLDFTVFGPNGVSGDGVSSTAFDMRGATTLTLAARPMIQNHLNAYLARHSDAIYAAGAAPHYSSVTNTAPVQQAGDTGSVVSVMNAPIIYPTLGVLDLTSAGGTDGATVSLVGDKIALSGGTYGFGIQSGRLVAYTPATSAGFAVRAQHATGQKSGGSDAVFLSSDGHGLFNSYAQAARFITGRNAQTILSNGAVTIDASLGDAQAITLQANVTSSAITNALAGQRMTIRWIQDATGGRTYAWPSNWVFAHGAAPPPVTIPGQWQASTAIYDGTNWNEVDASPGVLQGYNWLPSRQGLAAWTFPPVDVSVGLTPAAGAVKYQRIYIPEGRTVSTMWLSVPVAGTGATALANCYVAIFSQAGTRIAASADQSSSWASAGTKSIALVVDSGQSLNLVGGSDVYVWGAVLVGTQSTTNVQISGLSTNANNAINANMSPAMSAAQGVGVTAMPTSVTPSTLTNVSGMLWLALS